MSTWAVRWQSGQPGEDNFQSHPVADKDKNGIAFQTREAAEAYGTANAKSELTFKT